MLPQGNFTCATTGGIVTCQPTTLEGKTIVQKLAVRVHGALIQMKQAGLSIPTVQYPADGTIGPSLVLSLQTVMLAIAKVIPPPQHLAVILSSPMNAITGTSNYADELLAFIDAALMSRPDLFVAGSQPQVVDPSAMDHPATKYLTLANAAAVATGIAVLGGIAVLAHAADRRLAGRVDRTGLLDPVDDDEDHGSEGDDGYDYYEDDDGLPPGVIDAKSVEAEASA